MINLLKGLAEDLQESEKFKVEQLRLSSLRNRKKNEWSKRSKIKKLQRYGDPIKHAGIGRMGFSERWERKM